MNTAFLAMAMRPLMLLALMPVLALGVWLSRRYAPPWLRKVLLYKLWDIHPPRRPDNPRAVALGFRLGQRVRRALRATATRC